MFLSVDHDFFQVEAVSLEEAVENLRVESAKLLGSESPPVEIHRYANNPSTDANPWRMREALTISLRSASTYEILKSICDLTGYQMLADTSRVSLFQSPSFSTQLPSLDQFSAAPKKYSQEVESFRRCIIPEFYVGESSTLEATQKLASIYTDLTGQPAPTIGLIHYFADDAPPSKPAGRPISLRLEKAPVGEIIRYIAEVSGYLHHINEHTIVLTQLSALNRPKKVYIFPAKDIIRTFGQPQKHDNLWFFDIQVPKTAIWGSGYNPRTGKVFIVAEPDSAMNLQSDLKKHRE
jgi:hypothetical protein